MTKIFRVKNWPIAAKLIVVFVLIALLPLAITGLINNANTSSSLEDQIGESMAIIAGSTANAVSQMLLENIHLLQTRAIDDAMIEALEEANDAYSGTQEEIIAGIEKLDAQWREAPDNSYFIRRIISDDETINPIGGELHDFHNGFPQHVEVFVTDRYGANVASTGRTSDYYQADEGWWQAAWNDGAGAVYIGDPEYDESAGIIAVNIAVPVKNESNEVVGIARTTLDIQAVLDIIAGVTIGQTGHAMLVDQAGLIIADPTGELIGQPLEHTLPESTVLGETSGWVEAGGLMGDPEIIGLATPSLTQGIKALENLGWTALTIIESSEALAPVASATRLTLATGALIAVIAVVLAVLITRGLTGQIRHIGDLFSRIGIGEFDARTEVVAGDELGEMATSLNAMLDNTLVLIQSQEDRDAMQSAVVKLLDEVGDVAEGDLTVEAEVTADMTGAIADSFNLMIGQLRNIISDVQDATLQVSSSANEIQATTEHLSQGSEAQAMQIADISTSIEEMAASIQQVSENASTSSKVGEQALSNAQQGVLAVQNTIEGMKRIRDQVQETSKRIKRLGESSQEVGEIVQLIGDIADRTSILALNASIQAAMAGEAGQGFAVVAEEVERLAERSTEATKQIDTLIRTIQSETNEAVAAMEAATNEVVEGSGLAEEAGHALSEIGTVSNQLSDLIQSISQASKQQARGSENLANSVSAIAEVTQQTAAGTKQAAVSISNLANLADGLRESVSAFKLPGSNGNKNNGNAQEEM